MIWLFPPNLRKQWGTALLPGLFISWASFHCCQLVSANPPIPKGVLRLKFQTTSFLATHNWHNRIATHPPVSALSVRQISKISSDMDWNEIILLKILKVVIFNANLLLLTSLTNALMTLVNIDVCVNDLRMVMLHLNDIGVSFFHKLLPQSFWQYWVLPQVLKLLSNQTHPFYKTSGN